MEDGNNQNVEGAGLDAGGSGNANSELSQSNQPSIEGQTEQLLNLLKPMLASQVEELTKPYMQQLEGLKKVQGDIDRSRNDLKTQLAEINKLTKQGMSQEQAVEYLDRQKTESEWRQSLEKQLADLRSLIAGNGNGQQQNTVANVFQKYGLDPKDARVAPALAKQYKNAEEAEFAALRLFHQIHSSPNPNAAQQPSLQGGAGNRNTKDISQITDPDALYAMAENDIFGGGR